MSFALACDLITLGERATLDHAFTRSGLGPDGGASAFLLARIGWTRASGIMFEGRAVGAEEAVAIGLANRVRPTEGFRETVEHRVRELAEGPTAAHAAMKRVLNAQVLRHLEDAWRRRPGSGASEGTRRTRTRRRGVHEARSADVRGATTGCPPPSARSEKPRADGRSSSAAEGWFLPIRSVTRIERALRRLNRIPHLTRASWRTATSTIALAIGLTLVTAGPASASFWAPQHGGSPNADRIHALYTVLFVVGVIIFVAVFGALVYAMVKFRARPGAVAEQLHGNTRLEIGWTAGAAAIVLVLGIVTFIMLPGIRNPDESDADGWAIPAGFQTAKDKDLLPDDGKSLNIDVNGQQYAWRYTYPDADRDRQNNVQAYEEMVVPTGTTVTLDIRASDVGHAWWIPKLGGKADALPGYTNHTWFKIPRGKEGIYVGQCAELCGRNHANMTARVRAITPDEFTQWLETQKRSLAEAGAAAQAFRDEQAKSDAAAAAKSREASTTSPEAATSGGAQPVGAQR